MIYLNLFLITVICVIVIDLSDFIDSIKKPICNYLNVKSITLKPFDCSFCSSFWLNLIYLFYTGNIHIYTIALILMLSFLTENIKYLLILIKDTITKIINYLQ